MSRMVVDVTATTRTTQLLLAVFGRWYGAADAINVRCGLAWVAYCCSEQ